MGVASSTQSASLDRDAEAATIACRRKKSAGSRKVGVFVCDGDRDFLYDSRPVKTFALKSSGPRCSSLSAASGLQPQQHRGREPRQRRRQGERPDIDSAISKYEQATQLDPTNHRILWKLATAYQKKEDWDKVAATCAKAESVAPTHADYYFLHGYALEQQAIKGRRAGPKRRRRSRQRPSSIRTWRRLLRPRVRSCSTSTTRRARSRTTRRRSRRSPTSSRSTARSPTSTFGSASTIRPSKF